jgi:hypothetical protein
VLEVLDAELEVAALVIKSTCGTDVGGGGGGHDFLLQQNSFLLKNINIRNFV